MSMHCIHDFVNTCPKWQRFQTNCSPISSCPLKIAGLDKRILVNTGTVCEWRHTSCAMWKPPISLFDNDLNVPYVCVNLMITSEDVFYNYTNYCIYVSSYAYLWDLTMKNTCKKYMFVMFQSSFQPSTYAQHIPATVNIHSFVSYSFTQPSGWSLDVACMITIFCV